MRAALLLQGGGQNGGMRTKMTQPSMPIIFKFFHQYLRFSCGNRERRKGCLFCFPRAQLEPRSQSVSAAQRCAAVAEGTARVRACARVCVRARGGRRTVFDCFLNLAACSFSSSALSTSSSIFSPRSITFSATRGRVSERNNRRE